jgi:hypothetical protein
MTATNMLGHLFCASCAEKWTTDSKNCPYCRQEVMEYFPFRPMQRGVFKGEFIRKRKSGRVRKRGLTKGRRSAPLSQDSDKLNELLSREYKNIRGELFNE